MSQQPQGHGWWFADDGLWYPPERHPNPNYEASLEPQAAPSEPFEDEPTGPIERVEVEHTPTEILDPVEDKPTWHRLISPHDKPVDADYSHLPPPPSGEAQRNAQYGRVTPPAEMLHASAQSAHPKGRSRSDQIRIALAALVAVVLIGGAIGGIVFVLTHKSDGTGPNSTDSSNRRSATPELSGPGFEGVNSLEEYSNQAAQRYIQEQFGSTRQTRPTQNGRPMPTRASTERVAEAREFINAARNAGDDACAFLLAVESSDWGYSNVDLTQLGEEEFDVSLEAMFLALDAMVRFSHPSAEQDQVIRVRDYITLMQDPVVKTFMYEPNSVNPNDPNVQEFAERLLVEGEAISGVDIDTVMDNLQMQDVDCA